MKILIFIFSLLLISAVNSYSIEKVNGIVGDVNILEFDSNGNRYVFAFDGRKQLLSKLNSTNDVLWTIDTEDFSIIKIITNSRDEVYFNFFLQEDADHKGLAIVENLTIQEIDRISSYEPTLIDEEDNLYYNGLNGTTLLRPDRTSLIIENLENTYSNYDDEGAVVDGVGNVYIGVQNQITNNISIAMITKEAKQEKNPSAVLFNLDSEVYVEHLLADEKNNLWVFVFDSQTSYIKRITNGTMEDKFSDDAYRVLLAKVVKDRIYFFPAYLNHDRITAFCITSDGDIKKIPELENVAHNLFTYSSAVVDEEGNLYFGIYFPNGNNQVLIIRPEKNNTWISFPRAIRVRFIALDGNDDLWIFGDGEGVYVLKKGEEIPIEVFVPPEVKIFRGVNVNKKTNEVFLLSSNGLFVMKNDSN